MAWSILATCSLLFATMTVLMRSQLSCYSKELETLNLEAKYIYIYSDNARYYRSKLIQEYLKASKITLMHVPPYSPNLNLIERYWKFFKKKVLYGKYYEKFSHFKQAFDILLIL